MNFTAFKLIIIFLGLSISANAVSPSTADSIIQLAFTPNSKLCVRIGNQINFFQFQPDKKSWTKTEDHFELPENVDEILISSSALMLIRTGSKINFQYFDQTTKSFKTNDSLTFQAPCDPDEIIISANENLGIRCRADLKLFYYKNGWNHFPQYDTHLTFTESNTHLFFTKQNMLGIFDKKVLRFFDVMKGYNPTNDGMMFFDYNVDDILVSHDDILTVRSGKTVKFYQYISRDWK
jgi:hypothetical protein